MSRARLDECNIADLRALAARRLPRWLFEFVDRGSEDEVSLRNNRAVFERIRFLPRALVDVSQRHQEIELFGRRQPMPLAIAPTGIAGLMRTHGDLAIARAAQAAGIPFTLAAPSLTPLETIAREAGGRLWFQLYMWADRRLSHELVARVVRCGGFEALVVTVDGAVGPNREHNRRNGFTIPFRMNPTIVADVLRHPRWLLGFLAPHVLRHGVPRRENYPEELRQRITADPAASRNDSLDWNDLRRLREQWPGVLIVKGVLRADDAVRAADCGADGVILSNHGGRNLDGAVAPIEMLPAVVAAVGSRLTVMVDSGFRRGSDVVKALALGAKAVLIGRATLYGIAVAGQAGAARALDVFRDEIDRTLALLGCASVDDLDAGRVVVCGAASA